MKKLLLPLFFILTTLVNAQIVNIPDENFKSVLLSASSDNEIAQNTSGEFYRIDANNDGEIQVSEALETTYLNISENGLNNITGIHAFLNLEYLDTSRNGIYELDLSQNVNLAYLDCSEMSSMTLLDITQNINLIHLDLNYCYGINNFDISQNLNLEYLDVEWATIGVLDVTQHINLKHLNTLGLEFTDIDLSQNVDLEYFKHGQYNTLELDLTQNINLEYLELWFFSTSNLDLSQNVNLKTLIFYEIIIGDLDLTENINLENLDLFRFPAEDLDLTNNINLQTLSLEQNELMNLDLTNNTNLQSLYLYGGPYETLFIKNGSNEALGMNCPSLIYICADDAQLEDVEAQASSSTVVSSYCNFTPGGIYNTISGVAYFDADSNGCDVSDIRALNVRVDINNSSELRTTYADNSGTYYFYTQSGNYELLASIENPTWFEISPASATIEFTDNNNNIATQDFCVTPVGVHNDVEVVIVPITPAQPGFDATYQLAYRNKGNQTLSGEINFEYDEALLDYISASIAPDSQSSGIMTWNYSDLLPFESRAFTVTLNVNAPTETPAVNIGDELPFISAINPIVDDERPTDNEFQLKQIVVGSYDPNDKTCLEGDTVEPSQIGEYLRFNINFENTGTAAATFVVVKDFIDETMFDMSTLQVMYASHEMMTQVAGNKIEFIFDNINLGPEEKGNVVFKIKTLDTLNVGDSVTNDAEIFFDYNFPIVTNETNTTFQTLSVDDYQLDNVVEVYPNPTFGLLHINTQSVIQKIELYDVQGRLVLSQNSNQQELTLDTSDLTKGVYFLRLMTEQGRQIAKIIKD